MLEVVIDCVGGQEVEDASRAALGNKEHFVTAAGPGDDSFCPEIDTVKGLMGLVWDASARSFKVGFISHIIRFLQFELTLFSVLLQWHKILRCFPAPVWRHQDDGEAAGRGPQVCGRLRGQHVRPGSDDSRH